MEVRAISRAIDVLRYIGNAKSGVSLTEIAASVGLSKATTHRVLQTLQSGEFVRCDAATGYYSVGAEFLRLAHRADPHESLKRIARPFLESLRAATEETVALVVRDHDERLTIDVLLSPQELKATPAVGSKKPIHAGAPGKALLADANDAQLEALVARTGLPRLTATTVTSAAGLKREIARVRAVGYAKSIAEAVEGQGAVSVPIMVQGRVVAAINICGPTFRLRPNRVQRMIKGGVAAARRIAAELSTTASLQAVKGPGRGSSRWFAARTKRVTAI